jgi:catalase
VGSGEKAADLSEEIVDALEAINGDHPGCRRVHAKGIFCEGSFLPTIEASELCKARHFQAPTPALVRLSNASGNPATSDAHPLAGRGMAVKLRPQAGEETDIVSVPLPVFMVRTAEDFLAFTRAREPDPETGQPDPERLGGFVAEHPETARALQLGLPAIAPTTSFATSTYNALHAFRLVGSDGEGRWGRYEWSPEAGVEVLSDAEREAADRDYLRAEIRERLAAGPVRFRLNFRLAAEGDPLDDPTAPWEGEREVVVLGELELTGVVEDPETPEAPLVFDPMRLAEGIEPSDDPILAARPGAYSVSVARRCAV